MIFEACAGQTLEGGGAYLSTKLLSLCTPFNQACYLLKVESWIDHLLCKNFWIKLLTTSRTQGKHLTTRSTNFIYLSMTRWLGPWASGHQDCFACIFL